MGRRGPRPKQAGRQRRNKRPWIVICRGCGARFDVQSATMPVLSPAHDCNPPREKEKA